MTCNKYRNREQTQGNIHIDRQGLNKTEGTKYTDESNITRCKQVRQMKREADEGVSSGVQTRGSWEV